MNKPVFPEEIVRDMTEWRRDIHRHPETAFEEERTARIVAELLESWGIEVHRGLARTGVVGTLKVGSSPRCIGLRADLDALDLEEMTNVPWSSTIRGKMHACGHDGHTAMLLGAARYLAETRRFDGTVRFIFQPAEENVAGGRRMIEDGLFELFPVDAVYGMHNMPGLPVGEFAIRKGPLMAAADFFRLKITGRGGHGAFPHESRDPIVAAAQIVSAWQGIVSRNTDPMKAAVISVTRIYGGETGNVIPEEVELAGTTRSFEPAVQDMIEERMRITAEGIALACGVAAELEYERRYCATINSERETEVAVKTAAALVGRGQVNADTPPVMGAEDFGWMLRERPGAFIFIGNGTEKGGCMIHNPHYDFNDDILPLGAAYWCRLVEGQLDKG